MQLKDQYKHRGMQINNEQFRPLTKTWMIYWMIVTTSIDWRNMNNTNWLILTRVMLTQRTSNIHSLITCRMTTNHWVLLDPQELKLWNQLKVVKRYRVHLVTQKHKPKREKNCENSIDDEDLSDDDAATINTLTSRMFTLESIMTANNRMF